MVSRRPPSYPVPAGVAHLPLDLTDKLACVAGLGALTTATHLVRTAMPLPPATPLAVTAGHPWGGQSKGWQAREDSMGGCVIIANLMHGCLRMHFLHPCHHWKQPSAGVPLAVGGGGKERPGSQAIEHRTWQAIANS